MTVLRLVPLDAALADRLAPWFDDTDTAAYFGPRGLLEGLLALAPYAADAGDQRWLWAALDETGDPAVALVLERYEGDEGVALLSLATDPARRRQGYGRQAVALLLDRPELQDVTTIEADIAEGNDAAAAFFAACGFLIEESEHDAGWRVAKQALLATGR